MNAPNAETVYHDSDCSLHNEPVMPKGECDCGVAAFIELQEANRETGRLIAQAKRMIK